MVCKLSKVRLEIGVSTISGVGLFAVANIREDEELAEGVHDDDFLDIVTWVELEACDEEIRKKVMWFCVGTPNGFIPPENLNFNLLSIDWYMNHSCNGNVGFNDHGNFVARRPIRVGEELTYDYGLVESNPNFKMTCKCGAKNCRGVITGNDWKGEEFQHANTKWIHRRLRMV
jgi:hypothetical protein